MINESLPPLVFFNDMEVTEIIFEIIEKKMSMEDAFKMFKQKAKDKGKIFFDTSQVPPGAMM